MASSRATLSKRRALALVGVAGLLAALPAATARGSARPQHPRTPDGIAVRSDFNGDGYSDLAVGVPYESTRTLSLSGAVNVIYGSPGGLSATFVPDQLWTQDSPGVEGTADDLELFGWSLGSGDFNGDTYADLAIGVVGEEVVGLFAAGAVNVIYGSPGGLSTTFVPDQIWSQRTPNVEGEAADHDNFGVSVAGGDANEDGYDDLAVGVPGEGDSYGAAHMIYGSDSGLSATFVPDQLWSQDSPGVEGTAESDDYLGSTVTVGDFNGDSYGDLAAGAVLEAIGSAAEAGSVNVIYGSPAGLSATFVPDQLWSQDSPDVEGIAEALDRFGSALAVGDFNEDTRDDLAVGARTEDLGEVTEAGAVNVIYGSSTGLSATSVADQLWTQDSPSMSDAGEVDDQFGAALAAGDFNGDGFAELAMGVPGEFSDGLYAAGAVSVIYGSRSGLSATIVPDQLWWQGSPGVEGTPNPPDSLGESLTAADFGGRAEADLAVGVINEVVGSQVNAGGVNVLYGTAAGLSAAGDQLWSQNSPNVEGASKGQEQWGWSLVGTRSWA